MKWLPRIFRRQPVAEIYRDQAYDAERHFAEHMAAAEHHAALAGMYKGRLERIRRQQAEAGHQLRTVK